MTEYEKLAKIIEKGGSIVMHKNDIERLREARSAGQPCSIFNGVKIYRDSLGLVPEGKPLAVLMNEDGINFDFRDYFNA